VSFRSVCSSGCSWRTDVAITIFAKLGAFLLSSKSYRAALPSIFGFPEDLLGRAEFSYSGENDF
jgi:hypothetical protein